MADNKKKRELKLKLLQLETEKRNTPAQKAIEARKGTLLQTEGSPVVEQLLQGAAFGLSDEGEAIGPALIDALQGVPFGEAFEANRQVIDDQNRQFVEEHGALPSLGLQLAGGLATGGALFKGGQAIGRQLAPHVASRVAQLPKFLQTAIGATPLGAVAGAGFAEPGERLLGATTGGALGFGLGGATQPVIGLAQGLGGVAGNVLKGAKNKFAPALTQAQRKVAQNVVRDGVLPDEFAAQVAARGPGGAAIDAGGANVLNLGRDVASQPGKSMALARGLFESRNALRNSRVVGNIKKALGTDGANFDDVAEDIIKNRQKVAGPLYDAVTDQPVKLTPQLFEKLNRPSAREALKKGMALARDEGVNLEQFVDDQGNVLANPTVKIIDYTKRALDDMVEASMDNFKATNKTRVLRDLKGSIVAAVDRQYPVYKQARAVASSSIRMQKALDKGLDYLNPNTRKSSLMRKEFVKMPEGEKEMFRIGVARAYSDKVRTAADNADIKKRLAGNQFIREKLETVFGKKESTELVRMLDNEAAFKLSQAKVTGGSDTARILAGQEDIGVDSGTIFDVATGNKAGLVAKVLQKANTKLTGNTEQVRDEIGKILFTMGPDEAQKLVSTMVKELPKQQKDILINALGASLIEQSARVQSELQ